jgi:hypothetical protein
VHQGIAIAGMSQSGMVEMWIIYAYRTVGIVLDGPGVQADLEPARTTSSWSADVAEERETVTLEQCRHSTCDAFLAVDAFDFRCSEEAQPVQA